MSELHICATCLHADEFIFCGESGCADEHVDMWEPMTEENRDEAVIEIAIFKDEGECGQ